MVDPTKEELLRLLWEQDLATGLQRIAEAINTLLDQRIRGLSATDTKRLSDTHRQVEILTDRINNPDRYEKVSEQVLSRHKRTVKDHQRTIAELEEKATSQRNAFPIFTPEDAEKLLEEVASEYIGPNATDAEATQVYLAVARTLMTDRPTDVIPFAMAPTLVDAITDRTMQIQLFPTHVLREDQIGAVAKGLLRDGKITPGQLDALTIDRSNPKYSTIPEKDRAWAGKYLLDLTPQLPNIMAGITARAQSEQEGSNLNVPSEFRPVAFLSMTIGYIGNLNKKDFDAGKTAIPPTMQPEPDRVPLRDGFRSGPTGGEPNLKNALKDVLRDKLHDIDKAIRDEDQQKATTGVIDEAAEKLDTLQAQWRSHGFDEDQIADALFQAAQEFATPPEVAEGEVTPADANPSPFEQAVLGASQRAEAAAAAKKAETALNTQGKANTAVTAFLNSKLTDKKSITDARFLEMAKAVFDTQSIDVLEEQYGDFIPQLLQEKIAKDLGKDPKKREDAVVAYLKNKGVVDPLTDILPKDLFDMQWAILSDGSVDALEGFTREIIDQFLQKKENADFKEDPDLIRGAVRAILGEGVDSKVVEAAVRHIQDGLHADLLYDYHGFLVGLRDSKMGVDLPYEIGLDQPYEIGIDPPYPSIAPAIQKHREQFEPSPPPTTDIPDAEQIRGMIRSFRVGGDVVGGGIQLDAQLEAALIRLIQAHYRADPLFDINSLLSEFKASGIGRPPDEVPTGQPRRGLLGQEDEVAPGTFANLTRALAEDRASETPLTPEEAVGYGLPAEGGFDLGRRLGFPTIGELTNELGADAVTRLFTIEDMERRFGQLPPNIPESFGVPSSFPFLPKLSGQVFPTGTTQLPDIRTQRAIPRKQLLGLSFEGRPTEQRAFVNRISELVAELSGGDVDFQEYLLEEVEGLMEPFRQEQLALQQARQTAAADRVRPLEERGLFTPAQRGAYVRQTAVKPRKLFETEFPEYMRAKTPGLRRQFQQTPSFISRTKREMETAATAATTATEEAQRNRTRSLRRGRTVFSRRGI